MVRNEYQTLALIAGATGVGAICAGGYAAHRMAEMEADRRRADAVTTPTLATTQLPNDIDIFCSTEDQVHSLHDLLKTIFRKATVLNPNPANKPSYTWEHACKERELAANPPAADRTEFLTHAQAHDWCPNSLATALSNAQTGVGMGDVLDKLLPRYTTKRSYKVTRSEMLTLHLPLNYKDSDRDRESWVEKSMDTGRELSICNELLQWHHAPKTRTHAILNINIITIDDNRTDIARASAPTLTTNEIITSFDMRQCAISMHVNGRHQISFTWADGAKELAIQRRICFTPTFLHGIIPPDDDSARSQSERKPIQTPQRAGANGPEQTTNEMHPAVVCKLDRICKYLRRGYTLEV
jgi:hypothetical protein